MGEFYTTNVTSNSDSRTRGLSCTRSERSTGSNASTQHNQATMQGNNMKKHFVTALTTITLTASMVTGMFALTGCSAPTIEDNQGEDEDIAAVTSRSQRLAKVPDTTDLAYDIDTFVVYYMIKQCDGYPGYGWMSPYYGEHGRLYQYIDGEIVELSE